MKYIRRFENESDYQAFKGGGDWITPNVVYVNENSNLYLQPYEESGGGSNLITFTVDGTEYQAEEGMTWGDFYNSDYNDGLISESYNPPKDAVHDYPDFRVRFSYGMLINNSTNLTVKFGDKIDNLGVYVINYDVE